MNNLLNYELEGGLHDLERNSLWANGDKPWRRDFACIVFASLGFGCNRGIFTYSVGIFID